MKKIIPSIAILIIGAVVVVSLVKHGRTIVKGPQFVQTISTPEISFGYPDDFDLATTRDQVAVHSYIPPCSENMDYCVYYNSDAYKGTNFESAGLRVKNRADLATSTDACLKTPPDGYDNFTPATVSSDTYATSVFAPLSDGAAGHYASGALYRLFFGRSCYEFEARIGESQFANYPAGAIKQFTDADREALKARLLEILGSITITDGKTPVQFLPTDWWQNSDTHASQQQQISLAQDEKECLVKVTEQKEYLNNEKFYLTYTFDTNKVPVYSGPLADLDTASNPTANEFRTAIRGNLTEGINFGGKYTIVGIGMTGYGTNYFIVDRTNGKAYDFPYFAGARLDYRKDSDLIIMNPRDKLLELLSMSDDPTKYCYIEQQQEFADLRPFYFIWQSNEAILLDPKNLKPKMNEFFATF